MTCPNWHFTRIPNLARVMELKNATIHQLVDCSGVGESTIMAARKGQYIGIELAGCIVTALETRQFAKLKMGPR